MKPLSRMVSHLSYKEKNSVRFREGLPTKIECGDGVTGSMRSSQLRGGVRFPDPLQGE